MATAIASISPPRSRRRQARAARPATSSPATAAPTHSGPSHTGSAANGAAQTGAPVLPVAPVSCAAKVRPSGPCASEIIAAACGRVNVASSMKNPAPPPASASRCLHIAIPHS